eukprot:scaffold1691_cov107-Isochrysis_galbana.AAC.19
MFHVPRRAPFVRGLCRLGKRKREYDAGVAGAGTHRFVYVLRRFYMWPVAYVRGTARKNAMQAMQALSVWTVCTLAIGQTI